MREENEGLGHEHGRRRPRPLCCQPGGQGVGGQAGFVQRPGEALPRLAGVGEGVQLWCAGFVCVVGDGWR